MLISLVVPVFNEEESITVFHAAVRSTSMPNDIPVEIVFINDGSVDQTEAILRQLERIDPHVTVLSFTRNFGKEAALFAGLEHAKGDAIIPIDVDLQDPIEIVPQLVQKWLDGFDIVLAKRVDRTSDTYLKRRTAEAFYQLHNVISRPTIEPNVGDFRLLSKQTVEATITLKERNLFMKGVLSWVGGTSTIVEYSRAPRVAGKTKFNGWKLWNLALEGLTSFSTVPLRIWTYAGIFVSIFSLFFAIVTSARTLIFGNSVSGYTSIMVAILFLGGIQLIGIGVLGEYIGRIYSEVKERPRYVLKNDPKRRTSR
ncbi:glycosyltransferase family 2 protein [Brucella sp. NBRC 12950]|uniref:glycosyltransferase family 2 protein n=1 Tax=Brucella sp. NBRC 12950 TaxID=2994518 RepID=UPI0024A0CF0E|nr:glycosyltransferase family 2 protein [Brucella sp. NBRC 12950]GLU26089.1 bactoprenol glucosyl transferase [Brucella sp. NBRC 12950]